MPPYEITVRHSVTAHEEDDLNETGHLVTYEILETSIPDLPIELFLFRHQQSQRIDQPPHTVKAREIEEKRAETFAREKAEWERTKSHHDKRPELYSKEKSAAYQYDTFEQYQEELLRRERSRWARTKHNYEQGDPATRGRKPLEACYNTFEEYKEDEEKRYPNRLITSERSAHIQTGVFYNPRLPESSTPFEPYLAAQRKILQTGEFEHKGDTYERWRGDVQRNYKDKLEGITRDWEAYDAEYWASPEGVAKKAEQKRQASIQTLQTLSSAATKMWNMQRRSVDDLSSAQEEMMRQGFDVSPDIVDKSRELLGGGEEGYWRTEIGRLMNYSMSPTAGRR